MGFPFRGPDPSDDTQVDSRGSLKRFLGWVTEIDFAARLNNGLTAVTPGGAATESLPGVVQFASLAEATAGVSGKALSALRHAAVHNASSLADLNTRGLTLPSGSIIGLPFQDFTASNAGYLSPSFWYIDNGKIIPLVPLVATTPAALTYLVSVSGSGKTYSALYFTPGATSAIISGSADEYRYIGATTGFYLWRGTASLSFASGFADFSGASAVTVNGIEASMGLATSRPDGATVAPYQTLATLPAIARPVGERVFGGGVSVPSYGWYLANFAVQTAGTILLLATSTPTNGQTVAEGSITFKRQVPTA